MDDTRTFLVVVRAIPSEIRSWFEVRDGLILAMGSTTVYNDDGSVAEYTELVHGRLTFE